MLWKFLKSGGYAVDTGTVKAVTGDDPSSLEEWLRVTLLADITR
jgi:hypothetical protein